MKRHPALARLFIILTAILLSACGFQLRGSALRDSMPFKSIYVSIASASPINIELKRNLHAGDIIVTTDPKEAEVMMDVLSENKKREILSLNAQGRVREYRLTYTLRFRVRNSQGKIVLTPTTISQRRTLNYNESQAQAREVEQTDLYRDMQTDMVRQIMRRLAALKLT